MTDTALREAIERWYHRARERCGLELHNFAKTEAEETEKFRRRLHVHLCLMFGTALLSFFSIAGEVSVIVVTTTSTGILTLQELFDYMGRY